MASKTKTRPQSTQSKKAKKAKKGTDSDAVAPNSKPAKRTKRAKKAPVAPKAELTARTADRHLLYQWAVQSPEEDVRFLSRVYSKKRGKPALHFREDFCGTALLSATWVKRGKQYSAEGFDICGDTIAWGVEHNFEPIGDAASRVRLHMKDVRDKSHKKPDLRAAQNFSYFVFQDRKELLGYLKAAYRDLAKDGVFVMDIYGGPDSMMEMREEREIEEGFSYVWDQVSYWPATGEYKAHIHFEFPDGSEMKRAFTYVWRLWGLTEVIDALKEVGFGEVETFWEGTDSDGESGNGVYRKSRRGENCEAWVTYIVAYK